MSNINLFSASKKRKQNRIIFPVGTHTWKVPDNVREVEVHVWGGGGNGGSWNPNTDSVGAGGGGGGYARHLYKVNSGDSFSIVVGGQGGTSSVSTPSNPFPQPISATGGSNAPLVTTTPYPVSPPAGIPAPLANGVPYSGGAGGTGSIASIPVPLRVVGFTTTASGGAGGGIPDISTPSVSPLPGFTAMPVRPPSGWSGKVFGASGGAAGSHLGNGGNGAPAWGFTNQTYEGSVVSPFIWGSPGGGVSIQILVGAGGGGIGNIPGKSVENNTDPYWYKLETTKGGSSGFPDHFPSTNLGIRNTNGDTRQYVQDYPNLPPSTGKDSREIEWFYVEEISGTNYYRNRSQPFSPGKFDLILSSTAGTGAPGEHFQNNSSNSIPKAPFLGGGNGGGHSADPNSSPGSPLTFAYILGGSASVGGGGGGKSATFGLPVINNGTGGVGCVIIYW